MSESTAEKARRLADAGAVTITYRGPDGLVAQVAGDSATYRVHLEPDGAGGFCSCPARSGCSHLEAVRMVAGGLDDDDEPRDVDQALGNLASAGLIEDPSAEIIEPDDSQSHPLAIRGADPAGFDLATAPVTWRTLQAIAETELVPRDLRGRPAAILATVLYGRDLGLGPAEALAQIAIVEGRPQPSAELALRLYRQAGHRLTVEAADSKAVILVGERGDTGEQLRVTYCLDDALRAGLIDRLDQDGRPVARSRNGHRLPWEAHPQDLLWARAVTRLVRRLAPDSLAHPGARRS